MKVWTRWGERSKTRRSSSRTKETMRSNAFSFRFTDSLWISWHGMILATPVPGQNNLRLALWKKLAQTSAQGGDIFRIASYDHFTQFVFPFHSNMPDKKYPWTDSIKGSTTSTFVLAGFKESADLNQCKIHTSLTKSREMSLCILFPRKWTNPGKWN